MHAWSRGLMYAQRHQETKVILLKNFLSAFCPTSWSRIRRFSEFPTHLHILYMCAKLSKLKVATQYLALKTQNRESYFLRKWNSKKKKNNKNAKKTFFFLFNLSLPPYFEICKKIFFDKFSKPVLYEFSQFWAIFKFCLGQWWQKRWQWRWRHRWKFCRKNLKRV